MASLNDVTNTTGRLIAADQVNGTTVYSKQGEQLGTVEDIVIDKFSGRIVYAVLNFGGFLGFGGQHHPLPWDTLKYDPALGGYVVPFDKTLLEGGPVYQDTKPVSWDDRAWGGRIHSYYDAKPYWDFPT